MTGQHFGVNGWEGGWESGAQSGRRRGEAGRKYTMLDSFANVKEQWATMQCGELPYVKFVLHARVVLRAM